MGNYKVCESGLSVFNNYHRKELVLVCLTGESDHYVKSRLQKMVHRHQVIDPNLLNFLAVL